MRGNRPAPAPQEGLTPPPLGSPESALRRARPPPSALRMPVPCSGAFGTAINGSLEAPIDPTLADPLCRFVYIDAGANIGLQIEKLYDPALHSGSLI
jgi:hypothetical protein